MPIFKSKTDKKQVAQLLLDLVEIESINLNLEGGTDGEKRLAEYVQEWAQKRQYEVRRSYVDAERFNVLIQLPGRDRARTLLLEAHLDTVPIIGMSIHPFNNEVRDGKIWGRGACDDKGSLAAMMSALELLRNNGIVPDVDILLAATVAEEWDHEGIRSLLNSGIQAEAGIVGEPTELRIICCHRGNLRWKIEAHGVAAHSSQPEKGVNAIYRMTELITWLRDHYVPTLSEKVHPVLGKATFNVGKISGGVQANIIPDHCVIEVERRLLPGDNPEDVFQTLQEIINGAALGGINCQVEMQPPEYVEYPLDTQESEPIVQVAAEACNAIIGKAEVTGVPFGTDASDMAQSNIPAVVLGPGSITQAHSADEHIEIDQVAMAAEIYAEICARFPSE